MSSEKSGLNKTINNKIIKKIIIERIKLQKIYMHLIIFSKTTITNNLEKKGLFVQKKNVICIKYEIHANLKCTMYLTKGFSILRIG